MAIPSCIHYQDTVTFLAQMIYGEQHITFVAKHIYPLLNLIVLFDIEDLRIFKSPFLNIFRNKYVLKCK